MKPRTRVKICCIRSVQEARLATELGADALGLVGPMPSGPGVIPDDDAAAIARRVPPPVATFLLTSERTAEAIAQHVGRIGPTVVQIVNHVAPAESARLVDLMPGTRRVQVLHVEDERALELVDVYAEHVDAFLLDSGRPAAQRPELGGTGRVHDWDVSRRIVERSPLPVFLAGGLRPENVREAIETVRPFGVDLCTGVRTDGALDEAKLRAFLAAVGEADGTRGPAASPQSSSSSASVARSNSGSSRSDSS